MHIVSPPTISRRGPIYLLDNLLHIKPRLLRHWATTPGLNFIYVDLNRIIKARELNVILQFGKMPIDSSSVPAILISGWNTEPRCAGDARLEIHENGELCDGFAHAYGAAFDNPDLVVACVS